MAKILIADDEQKIREVIREYSEFNGHEVTEMCIRDSDNGLKGSRNTNPVAAHDNGMILLILILKSRTHRF